MPRGYEDRYPATGERHRRDHADDRGDVNRAGDEVRPWLDDDEDDDGEFAGFAGDRYWSPYETGPEPFRHPLDMPDTSGVRGPGFRGRGPKGYQRADERIYEDICERLTYADVDAENIEVKVAGGEVTLSGAVGDRRDKRHAEDIAEEVAGVRDVHNKLRVVSAADYLP